jgi:two-component sensor histidine kinase
LEPPDYTSDGDRPRAFSQFGILDTPPERGFDDIVEPTTPICDTPVALVQWREVGGPDVTTPSLKGFGSRLVNIGLRGTGDAHLHYHRSGFEADFAAPLAELQA